MPTPLFDDAELYALLPRLRRFALQLTQDTHAADDLVQDCLERALSRAPDKRPDGDLRAWLFSILYRRFVDDQRRRRRFGRLLDWFGTSEATAPSPEDAVVTHSVLAALATLPSEQRALLLLISVEGLSYREAADAFGIPIGTVMSRLSRARQALRTLSDGDTADPKLRAVK